MRRRIVAGNWKMNMDHEKGASLASAIVRGLEGGSLPCEVVLIPPFTTLPAVSEAVEGTALLTGAQDLWYEKEGAYTGEISGAMLTALGCAYVLVGHSERRHVLGEESPLLARKLRAALESGLMPIFCVGETLEQRESGKAERIVRDQIEEVLEGIGAAGIDRTVVAYEPVWAIGTGKTATPEDAEKMHSVIRETLGRLFNEESALRTTILYGGSVKPGNAASLMSMENIDGALVGGASLAADPFLGIISAVD